jgi:hypothetical protein
MKYKKGWWEGELSKKKCWKNSKGGRISAGRNWIYMCTFEVDP